MNLIFKYSEETEFERVKYTLLNKSRYKKYGYKVFLPSGYSLDTENLNDLKKLIKREFDHALIDKVRREIIPKWEINKDIINNFLEKLPYEKPNDLIIQLSQYGVGGSYDAPGRIIINTKYGVSTLKNIIHEIIHCIIEKPVVRKNELDQAQKEGLVDWLMINEPNLRSLFPNYNYQRVSLPPDNKMIAKLNWNSLIK